MLDGIDREIKDMVTGIEKIDNNKSTEIGYHHKIEWKIELINACLHNIGCIDDRYKT